MSFRSALSDSIRAGLHAAGENLVPGLILQAVALTIACAYYFYPPVHGALEHLAAFRSHAGLPFSMVSTGVCGGVIPFLYLRTFAPSHHRPTLAAGVVLALFWAYKGVEVDLWYRLMGYVFGQGHAPSTVALKTLCDQFVYGPVLAVPLTVLVYLWVEERYSSQAVVADLRASNWYGRRSLTPLISNMGIWLPAVTIIYSLPSPLQLPMQNLVLVFFSLILAHLMRKHQTAS